MFSRKNYKYATLRPGVNAMIIFGANFNHFADKCEIFFWKNKGYDL
jgi:hypothetical protein